MTKELTIAANEAATAILAQEHAPVGETVQELLGWLSDTRGKWNAEAGCDLVETILQLVLDQIELEQVYL